MAESTLFSRVAVFSLVSDESGLLVPESFVAINRPDGARGGLVFGEGLATGALGAG
jgi:hypothetical protein